MPHNKKAGFSLVELMGAVCIILILALMILAENNISRADVSAVKLTDRITALNTAENNLANYVDNVQGMQSGADTISTAAGYTSSDPATRENFLYQKDFLTAPVDVSGLTVTNNGTRWLWEAK